MDMFVYFPFYVSFPYFKTNVFPPLTINILDECKFHVTNEAARVLKLVSKHYSSPAKWYMYFSLTNKTRSSLGEEHV